MNKVKLFFATAVLSGLAVVGAGQASHAATLGGYAFEPAPGSPNATGVAPGLTFSPFEYVGDGTTNYPVGYDPSNPPQNNGGKSFSADSFSPDSTIDINNPNADDYFKFSIAADPGYTFNLTALNFVAQPNGNAAPTTIQIRSSLDNFASTLFDGALGPKNEWTPFNIPLALQNLTAITFRFYPYGENTNNGAKNLDIDNVGVQGEAIPTPALLPGMIGLGMGLLRKRKQQGEEVAV
ncbi:PTPA-CTERM sorting domain-containing protein [Alkalinema sp. FACHB-956]|uniref:PTPA-CTERM sorting domain-containing protein n=1 Tax=Alkalinema sp. FACHB-956 TaxID=2692768 RepID=UPI001689FE9B|nr:PTPA-CTERM sorting domain-containing protein [Alkalinema sp. FACHB-956]MBD2330109.1 PTPA-CTERM sorting domain-containing protein [Alkalinema sp. FACHB-956]